MSRVIFKLIRIPDLSLRKYNAYETTTQDELLAKQVLFLKQLHSICYCYKINAHLLYCFNYKESVNKGKRLSCYLYFNEIDDINIEVIRAFIEKSILTDYFSFELVTSDEELCKLNFKYCSYLTRDKIDINIKRHEGSRVLVPKGVGIREWIPNDSGRIYNLLKILEQLTYAMRRCGGYFTAYRVDLFPVAEEKIFQDINQEINKYHNLVYSLDEGKDHAAELLMNLFVDLNKKYAKSPIFKANIVGLSDSVDVTQIMMDYIGNEATEEGTFNIQSYELENANSTIYWHDDSVICNIDEINTSPILECLSIFTVSELNPIFSFPVLYPAESIEFLKESDPVFNEDGCKYLDLGKTDKGYKVQIPLDTLTKHAFIAGVPGSGKTYTMFHILTELWGKHKIPFIVFEPAKKEYRELYNVNNEIFKDINFFSPSFKTRFQLHINPFEFPIGITLDEHLSNLMMVFQGSFHIPEPGPHLLEESLLKIYEKFGWKEHTVNKGELKYPTIDDLYLCFEDAISAYKYDMNIKGNLEAILKVRIGSLKRRIGGDVYNVSYSTIKPEEWIEKPVIIELEQLGKDRANFMVLLLCALIRETLTIKELSRKKESSQSSTFSTKLKHLIFIEEAHNLIGTRKENLTDTADPKVAATNFIVDMIAEVRNIGEGIVIADQLPSVMAPEVLKNTSLKITHRLTSKDDRESIGSSMASTPDQIDEQLTLTEGEAFVFYDKKGLEKSFKMKVNKWDPLVKNSYAKDDDELVQYLYNNENYRKNISENFLIRLTTFDAKLDQLFEVEIEKIENGNEYIRKDPNELAYLFSKMYEIYKDFVAMEEIFDKQLNASGINSHNLLVAAQRSFVVHTYAYVDMLGKLGIFSDVLKKVLTAVDRRIGLLNNNKFLNADEINVVELEKKIKKVKTLINQLISNC